MVYSKLHAPSHTNESNQLAKQINQKLQQVKLKQWARKVTHTITLTSWEQIKIEIFKDALKRLEGQHANDRNILDAIKLTPWGGLFIDIQKNLTYPHGLRMSFMKYLLEGFYGIDTGEIKSKAKLRFHNGDKYDLDPRWVSFETIGMQQTNSADPLKIRRYTKKKYVILEYKDREKRKSVNCRKNEEAYVHTFLQEKYYWTSEEREWVSMDSIQWLLKVVKHIELGRKYNGNFVLTKSAVPILSAFLTTWGPQRWIIRKLLYSFLQQPTNGKLYQKIKDIYYLKENEKQILMHILPLDARALLISSNRDLSQTLSLYGTKKKLDTLWKLVRKLYVKEENKEKTLTSLLNSLGEEENADNIIEQLETTVNPRNITASTLSINARKWLILLFWMKEKK